MKKAPLTHGEALETIQNRYRIEEKTREARKRALGLDTALPPDAGALAQDLSRLIGQLKRASFARGLKRTLGQSGEPAKPDAFPSANDPLEMVKLPQPYQPPETHEKACAEILYCAIRIAQSAPEWVHPERGTFSALETLFEPAVTEYGVAVRFDSILRKIPQVFAENPENGEIWYGKELVDAANRVKSEEMRTNVSDFFREDVVLFRYVAQAVSLYLKEAGFQPSEPARRG